MNQVNPYEKNTKLHNLFERMMKIEKIKQLLIDKQYIGTLLHSCVLLTYEYKFLNEYIDEYLNLYPNQIDIQNAKGETALMVATFHSGSYSTIETVKILLKHNANVNIQDGCGWTALIHSVYYSDSTKNTTKLLLEYDSDINIHNVCGNTALMCYILYHHRNMSKKIIKAFLDRNANLNIQNLYGTTATQLIYKLRLQFLKIEKGKRPLDDRLLNRKNFITYVKGNKNNKIGYYDYKIIFKPIPNIQRMFMLM